MPRHIMLFTVLLGFLATHPMPADAGGCLTVDCHQAMAGVPYLHDPVLEEDCLACHEQTGAVHPAPTGNSYRINMSPGELCGQCHEFESRRHSHPPFAEDRCLSCHDPHGSSTEHFLEEDLPQLCYRCHDGIRAEVKDKVRHAAVYRKGSCGLCHSGHSSELASLLLARESELCLTCHGQDDYRRSNPLRNIGSEIEGKPYLHGPVADGECSPCHAPHGSPFYRLLRADYPQGPYASYGEEGQKAYELCFECHDRSILASPKGEVPATGFRDSKRNLHTLHVANPRKGRTCTTCHASHASTSKALIHDQGVRFGSWTIPVNFQATPTGGSCAPGCHTAAAYDRGNP